MPSAPQSCGPGHAHCTERESESMPEFNVNSDTTAQTSSSLLSSFNQLTEQLTQVQN